MKDIPPGQQHYGHWIMLKQLVGQIGKAAGLSGLSSSSHWRRRFRGSQDYWVRRYANGRTSGSGSYGQLAEFKARVLNEFVREHGIQSVIEFGCGDGNQLALASYPRYIGLDVSEHALVLCRSRFAGDATKLFLHLNEDAGETAELALSLDVLYHLVEDEVFARYMRRLLDAATRHVVIYSSNTDQNPTDQGEHVRHRRFTDWVAIHRPQWRLTKHLPNEFPFQGDDREGSFADFYFYSRISG